MTYSQRPSGAKDQDTLRVNAETLLQDGSAPSTGSGSLSVEALELLYRRASDPEFAADALKLLHELQTHQVELDLVFDQMQSSEIELTDALAHYQALYDMAPTPYLIVDAAGLIVESNQAANSLFGLSPEGLTEHNLCDFLVPASRDTVKAMLQQVESSESEQSCVAELSSRAAEGPRLALKAKPGSGPGKLLLVLSTDTVISGA